MLNLKIFILNCCIINIKNKTMDEFLSVIKLYAGSFVPKGYLLCDGRLMSINENQALFSLLGTIYGGDGRTNFALPKITAPSSNGDENSLKYIICVQGVYPQRD